MLAVICLPLIHCSPQSSVLYYAPSFFKLYKEGKASPGRPLAQQVRWISTLRLVMPKSTLTIVTADAQTSRQLKDEKSRTKFLHRLQVPTVTSAAIFADQEKRLRAEGKTDAALLAHSRAVASIEGLGKFAAVGGSAKIAGGLVGGLVGTLRALSQWAKKDAREKFERHVRTALHDQGFVGAAAPSGTVLYLIFRTVSQPEQDAAGGEQPTTTVALDMRLLRPGQPALAVGRHYRARAYPKSSAPAPSPGFRPVDPSLKHLNKVGTGAQLLMRAAAVELLHTLEVEKAGARSSSSPRP